MEKSFRVLLCCFVLPSVVTASSASYNGHLDSLPSELPQSSPHHLHSANPYHCQYSHPNHTLTQSLPEKGEAVITNDPADPAQCSAACLQPVPHYGV